MCLGALLFPFQSGEVLSIDLGNALKKRCLEVTCGAVKRSSIPFVIYVHFPSWSPTNNRRAGFLIVDTHRLRRDVNVLDSSNGTFLHQ